MKGMSLPNYSFFSAVVDHSHRYFRPPHLDPSRIFVSAQTASLLVNPHPHPRPPCHFPRDHPRPLQPLASLPGQDTRPSLPSDPPRYLHRQKPQCLLYSVCSCAISSLRRFQAGGGLPSSLLLTVPVEGDHQTRSPDSM